MSKVDGLIAEHCPDGVEFVEIGALIERAPNINWDEPDGEEFEYIDLSSVDRQTNRITGTTTIDRDSAPSRAQQIIWSGDVLFGTTRPMLKRCCTVGEDYDGHIASTGFCVLRPTHRISTKWLYHLLGTPEFYEHVEANQRGASYPAISDALVKKFRIPVPPLTVQHEIASILDKMESVKAELEVELEAELDLRSRQYALYRDSLLKFDSTNCKWLTLSEIAAEFGRGKSKHRPRNDPRLYGGSYPFIQTGDVRNSGHLITEYSQTYNEEGLAQSKLWPRGTVCITIAANIAETGILDFEACFPDSVVGLVVDPDKTSQGFVEYLLKTFKSNLISKGQGGAQENINLATFANERLPFPPLKEQELVVAILDKFDALVNDLSIGLLAEIAARRAQYEHYRDRLLTFDEATT